MINRLIIRSIRFLGATAIAVAASSVAAQDESLEAQFSQANSDLEQLTVSNRLLQLRIERQGELLTELEDAIEAAQSMADEENSPLLPLIEEMMTSIEQFVESDLPFELDSRREQVNNTRSIVDNDEASIQQKMQRILTLYQAETLYGTDMDTYEETVEVNGSEIEADIVRIGRIALAYQSKDRTRTGIWDNEAREWVELAVGDYRTAIQRAIMVARSEVAPEILFLPIRAPQPAEQ